MKINTKTNIVRASAYATWLAVSAFASYGIGSAVKNAMQKRGLSKVAMTVAAIPVSIAAGLAGQYVGAFVGAGIDTVCKSIEKANALKKVEFKVSEPTEDYEEIDDLLSKEA